MKRVTRERLKIGPEIDRIACPWVIARFIDDAPEFLLVPADEASAVADTFFDRYNLDSPALRQLAVIVREAV